MLLLYNPPLFNRCSAVAYASMQPGLVNGIANGSEYAKQESAGNDAKYLNLFTNNKSLAMLETLMFFYYLNSKMTTRKNMITSKNMTTSRC